MLLFDRAFKKLIKQGELIVSDADGKVYRYGVPYPGRDPVAVRFTTKSTSRKIVMAPSLGAGEAYMDGRLVMEQGDIRLVRSGALGQRNLAYVEALRVAGVPGWRIMYLHIGTNILPILLADFLSAPALTGPAAPMVAFEFRHESWFAEDTYAVLRLHNAALCIADTEDLATPKISTADYGYLRLRREDYKKTDIERWAKFVQQQESKWKDAFVYFKHEESGIGPKLAKQMMEILD